MKLNAGCKMGCQQQVTQQPFPTSTLKTAWNEGVLQIHQVYKSFLNDGCPQVEISISFKMLKRPELGVVHF